MALQGWVFKRSGGESARFGEIRMRDSGDTPLSDHSVFEFGWERAPWLDAPVSSGRKTSNLDKAFVRTFLGGTNDASGIYVKREQVERAFRKYARGGSLWKFLRSLGFKPDRAATCRSRCALITPQRTA